MAAATRRLNPTLANLLIVLVLAVLAGGLTWWNQNPPRKPLPPLDRAFPTGELRVGVDPTLSPFAVDNAGTLSGFEIDLARAVGDHLGVPVRFVGMGFDGLYDSLKVDQVDVLFARLSVDASRNRDVWYTVPYFNAGLVLVSPAAHPIGDMSLLPGMQLAYAFGSPAETETRRWLRRVQAFETRPYQEDVYALDAVRVGEANAALVDSVTAAVYARQYPALDSYQVAVTDQWFSAATRSDRPDTWEAINQTLENLRDDGTLAALQAQWL